MVQSAAPIRTERDRENLIAHALRRVAGDRDWADMQQEARLAIWQKGLEDAAPWLICRVAANAAIDYLRQRDGRNTGHGAFTPLWQGEGPNDPGYDWIEKLEGGRVPDFSTALIDHLEGEALFLWVKLHLKEKVARVIVSHFRHGCTYREIAVTMGVDESRVYQWVMLGLERLRAAMGQPPRLAVRDRKLDRQRYYARTKDRPERREKVRGYARAYYARKRAAARAQQQQGSEATAAA